MTAGVLADLSPLMEELDLADYLGGVFEAGWFEGGQRSEEHTSELQSR